MNTCFTISPGSRPGPDGKAEAMPVTPERFNVYAEWGHPVVVLSTHMDTVPPFIASREDDDNIYGRGACDAKGIIAAMIAAAEKLIESGTRNFGLLFVVGEERNSAGAEVASRSPRGSRYLINGEPTESKVALGSKGILRYEIVAAGKMAHSAYPELGESAIEKLLDALDAVRRMPLPEDPVLGRTTVNIGTISGGRAPNIIPDAAKAELAIRLVGDGREDRSGVARSGWRSRGGEGNSDASGDAFCVARRISDFGGGVYDRYSGAGAGVGRAVLVRTGQHSRGAHDGGKDFQARIARRGGYLCKNDSNAACRGEAGAGSTWSPPEKVMPKNLAIVGYGKMGRLIEQLAPEAGFSVGLKLDIDTNVNQQGITPENFRGVDVAIEFSTPHVAVANLERLCAIGVPTVVGTTGWYGELERVREFVDKSSAGVVWSANYSIGVNVFRRVVAEAARLLANEPEYGAWAWEVHHSAKKDAPSGTLLQLVEEMKRAGYTRPIDASSNRAGANPGTHEIGFDSAADTITLRHTARSREGFARGALKAAQWVIGKRGLHEFGEVIFADDAKTVRSRRINGRARSPY